ncbi:uncharacterized protein LOC133785196 [Humulus lupulus]|uniref:uncharacterized protein LOC133785196 n=1 Tax=Humulus lupulus TaxID=3486 RepID=UPI002B41286E|nr:uncharacterized protein LOC133785196 [Humulus lupulus]
MPQVYQLLAGWQVFCIAKEVAELTLAEVLYFYKLEPQVNVKDKTLDGFYRLKSRRPFAQTPVTQFIMEWRKFYSRLSAEDLDVGGYVNTDNLRLVGMLTTTQTIIILNLLGIACEKNVVIWEQLALDHIAEVEKAWRADAAQRKKDQGRTKAATSEELFEDALPNTGAPGTSVSGRGDSGMSTPASEMRRLLKDRAARKAARKASEATGPEPSPNKEVPGTELLPGGGALAAIPIQAVEPAVVSGPAQNPVIDLEAGAPASQSSGKRGLEAGAKEADTGKRPRTRRACSAEESHGESRLATKEVDLMSHRSADLVDELAVKMETAKLELEVAVNQREAAKGALGQEMARAQAEREEFDRAKVGLEEALSRKTKEADERATLLEAVAAQSVLDKEEIQTLKARVCELGDSLLEEKAAHEASCREKEEAKGMLEKFHFIAAPN